MRGARSRWLVVALVLTAVATMLVPPLGAQPRSATGADTDGEPARAQRSTRPAEVPVPIPLPSPPPDLDMRPPVLGPGGLHLAQDGADPSMLVVDGTYYLFSTNNSVANVPAWTSTDLSNWRSLGDAMPELPAWAADDGGTTWAPSVHRVGDSYNLYFSGLDPARGRFCIGAATSAHPAGPYRPRRRPLVCHSHRGGAIDPYLFTGSGSAPRLLFKTDGNCCDLPVKLWSQRLTSDGLRAAGKPSELLEAGAAWEEGLIEGPAMVERAGRYHLFYSGNWWHTHYYAIGHAVCETAAGPCYRSSPSPLVINRSDGVGFGGPTVWEAPSEEVWMSYHGWYGPGVGYENGGIRAVFAHRLDFPDWRPPPLCFGAPATLVGSSDRDIIRGTPGPDVIVGRGGSDVINGGGGDDRICGGGGHDVLTGGRGNDRIRGDRGRDLVTADGGKDFVDGGPGNDELRGGRGADQVWGAGGVDVCWGERIRCETRHPTHHQGR